MKSRPPPQHRNELVCQYVLRQFAGDDHGLVPYSTLSFIRTLRIGRRADHYHEVAVRDRLLHEVQFVVTRTQMPSVEDDLDTAFSLEPLSEFTDPLLMLRTIPRVGEECARRARGRLRHSRRICGGRCRQFRLIEIFLPVTGNSEPVSNLLVVVN